MNRFAVLTVLFFSVPPVSVKQRTRRAEHFLALLQISHNIGLKQSFSKVAALSPQSSYTTRSMSP